MTAELAPRIGELADTRARHKGRGGGVGGWAGLSLQQGEKKDRVLSRCTGESRVLWEGKRFVLADDSSKAPVHPPISSGAQDCVDSDELYLFHMLAIMTALVRYEPRRMKIYHGKAEKLCSCAGTYFDYTVSFKLSHEMIQET